MNVKQLFLIPIILFNTFLGYCQDNTTIELEEITLSDVKLTQFSEGIKKEVIKDSTLERSSPSLTELVRFNSTVFFKENGFGAVSSASFRGTNASQTAVVWNGININSQLNGQTDFNTIIPQNYDNVTIRSGGGSSQYGSGAIGGSIHLNDVLFFAKHLEHQLQIGYGDFNTSQGHYNFNKGNQKTALKFGISHTRSDNDYRFLNTDIVNENGEYKNTNISGSAGFFLNTTNIIKIYHNTFIGNRNFPRTLTAPSNNNYRDFNSRSLVDWTSFKENKSTSINIAYIFEKFRFFPNKDQPEFDFGQSENTILKYKQKYNFGKVKLNGIIEYNGITASGSSIQKENRDLFAGTFLLSHEISKQFSYGVNFRKDIVNDYKSPFIFSFNSGFKPTDNQKITLNGSRNFRIPTFNDLYWTGPNAQGNNNLIPESSLQLEAGYKIQKGVFDFKVNSYYIKTRDLIQWLPNISGIWSPINLSNVTQYGLEYSTMLTKSWKNQQLVVKSQYAFIKSINDETGNQLISVPKHKVNTNIAYQFKKWGFYMQSLYNGEIYTTTDNSDELAGYYVANLGMHKQFKITNNNFKITLKINNLFNKDYQNVAFRPMPNRNIQLQINTKF